MEPLHGFAVGAVEGHAAPRPPWEAAVHNDLAAHHEVLHRGQERPASAHTQTRIKIAIAKATDNTTKRQSRGLPSTVLSADHVLAPALPGSGLVPATDATLAWPLPLFSLSLSLPPSLSPHPTSPGHDHQRADGGPRREGHHEGAAAPHHPEQRLGVVGNAHGVCEGGGLHACLVKTKRCWQVGAAEQSWRYRYDHAVGGGVGRDGGRRGGARGRTVRRWLARATPTTHNGYACRGNPQTHSLMTLRHSPHFSVNICCTNLWLRKALSKVASAYPTGSEGSSSVGARMA